MFLLRACFSSDVQDVSRGPGQHDLVKFGLTTADISHFNNFSFQESTVYIETELESGARWECSCNKACKPLAAGMLMPGFRWMGSQPDVHTHLLPDTHTHLLLQM